MARERQLDTRQAQVLEHQINKEAERHASRLNRDASSLVQTNNQWIKTAEDYGNDYSAMVFQGKPFIYDWLSVRRDYHEAIAHAEDFANKKGRIKTDFAGHKELDIFDKTFRSTSLLALEKMELPLSGDSIKQINRLYRSPETGYHKDIVTALNILALQSVAQPETKSIPQNIEPLQETITNYFDYYTDLFTNTQLPDADEAKLLLTLLWTGPKLVQNLAAYLPAKRGITPSSAEKIFQRRLTLSSKTERFNWSKLDEKRGLTVAMKKAYNPSKIPPLIEPFIHYDAEQDDLASTLLQEYYAPRLTTSDDRFRVVQEKDELVSQIGTYHKDLRREILKSPDKTKQVLMEGNPLIQRIMVSEIYKGNLVFVLFIGNEAHLTLEIDSKGTVYGFPPSLQKSYPFIEDAVVKDVLTTVAGKFSHSPLSITSPNQHPVYAPALTSSQNEMPQENETPKRKRLQLMQEKMTTIFNSVPELPSVSNLALPQRELSYSEDEVRDFLGEKADIDPILTALSRFERGEKRIEALSYQGTEDHLFKMRVGDMRIILKHLGNGKYILFDVKNRRDAYKNL